MQGSPPALASLLYSRLLVLVASAAKQTTTQLVTLPQREGEQPEAGPSCTKMEALKHLVAMVSQHS